jgi:hypothetical protein
MLILLVSIFATSHARCSNCRREINGHIRCRPDADEADVALHQSQNLVEYHALIAHFSPQHPQCWLNDSYNPALLPHQSGSDGRGTALNAVEGQ